MPGVASGPKTPRRLAATTIASASWPSTSPTATATMVRPNRNSGLLVDFVHARPDRGRGALRVARASATAIGYGFALATAKRSGRARSAKPVSR